MTLADQTCKSCGHALEGNNHGPDQNDFYWDGEKNQFAHRGLCTYCRVCWGR